MNQKKNDFDIFLQPAFLLALLVLIVNDFYLKSHYPNWLTGKLSDFAGLYVFVQFVAALSGIRIARVAIASAILFAVWKSPLATPLIGFINQYSPIQIHRVIDYTDLAALMMLPLAVRLYSARTASHWNFMKYPIGIFAMLSIMATTVFMPTYSIKLNLQNRQPSGADISATYAQLDSFFSRQGMQCHSCEEGSFYREYYHTQKGITVYLNYDDTGGKLFASFIARSSKEETLEKSWTDGLQSSLMNQLHPGFEDITMARSSSPYEVTEVHGAVWKLEVEAPPSGFPLICAGNGINHPEIAKAWTIVVESLRIPSVVRQPVYYPQDAKTCELDLYETVYFGKVTGPHSYDRSIKVDTRGYISWNGTSFYIEVAESSNTLGQAHDFVRNLERRLRISLGKEARITLTEPDVHE